MKAISPVEVGQRIRIKNTPESLALLSDVGCPTDVVEHTAVPTKSEPAQAGGPWPNMQEFLFDRYPYSSIEYKWWVPLTEECIAILPAE